jgi:two-component system phosphate regulon response regulator PhoB
MFQSMADRTKANSLPAREAQGAPLVLVVEDEAALVTLLRYNLERAGFRVIDAANGEEALLIVKEQRPDLILLDWMLPALSGIEVCRQVRRSPEHRRTPIIMLTARGEEGDKLRGLEVGADDYVTKPFSPSELVARSRAVLRRALPQAET